MEPDRLPAGRLKVPAALAACWPCRRPGPVLAAAAYVLAETLRRTALKGTELEATQAGTIRLKLFKVAAGVITSVRRVVLHLSSAYQLAELFARVLTRVRALASLDGLAPRRVPYALQPAPS